MQKGDYGFIDRSIKKPKTTTVYDYIRYLGLDAIGIFGHEQRGTHPMEGNQLLDV